MISFTEAQTLYGDLTQNTTTTNLARGAKLANIEHRYLLQKYFNNEGSFNIKTVAQQQFYRLPPNYSKLKTLTITVGTLQWTPTEILTREEWDKMNVFPYYSDIPNFYFIYPGGDHGAQIGIWPIPSTGSTKVTYTGLAGGLFTVGDAITDAVGVAGKIIASNPVTATTGDITISIPMSAYGTTFATTGVITDGTTGATATISIITLPVVTTGNTITFNYKYRVADLSMIDYNTDTGAGTVTGAGTITITNGSVAVVGAGGTSFPVTTNAQLESRWIKVPQSEGGDNLWYQIQSVDSTTAITLYQPYQGKTIAGKKYTIGQMPLLMEDFQDMLVWKPIIFYYSTIVPDPTKVKEFQGMYNEKLKQLDEYAGSKTINVNLGRRPMSRNPNLYGQTFG